MQCRRRNKMTEQEAKKLHYELWDWLSHHPSKEKEDWPGFKNVDVRMVNFMFCFACLTAANRWKSKGSKSENEHICDNCPLENIACQELRTATYFSKWTSLSTGKTRSKYARLLRDSWKED